MSRSTVAKSRRSLRVVPSPAPRALPCTFPVRFNATAGLASLLRRAQNSYRWVGAGSVLLDQQGIQITGKRLTLLGLRRTEHFILPSEIREVYREGNTIRIDLHDTRRSFVRLWAEDVASAAELVRLLPTNRTIELEGGGERAREGDTPQRSLLWFVPVVLVAGVLTWFGTNELLPSRQAEPARPQLVAPAVIHPARIPAELSLEARGDLQKFIPRIDALATEFGVSFDAVQRGYISQEDFRTELDRRLGPQWAMLASELPPATPTTSSVRTDADAQISAVIAAWRLVLLTYAQGLHDNDYREVLKAFDYLRDAEAHEREAMAFLDRLERDASGGKPTG